MRNYLLAIIGVFSMGLLSYGQTTITTNHPNNNGNGSVTFEVQNTNAFDIIITDVLCHLGSTATNNIELLYNTTPYVDNSPPWSFGTVGSGQNGWISAGTGVVSNSNTSNGIVTALSSLSLTIPAGATYQLALSATTMQYSSLTNGAGINTFTGGGVNLLTGDGISWGGAVYPTTPTNYPRGLIGGITFIPAVPCTSPPTAGIVGAANNPICPSVNNTLSITGGTGGTGQTYQWQNSLTGAVGSFTNIGGATNNTYISNQTADTYYRCVVTCGGMTDTTTALMVSTSNFINCYCNSNATSTGDEEILNVSIGTLNNSSTCGSTGGAGSIQNQYSNYTTLPATNLARTVSYGLNVQVGTCGGNYSNMTKVYIDYNQNGLFSDPGEEVYASATSTTGPHNEVGTILIPLTATLGNTRMRVITVETTVIGSITPCGTYSWGETEDYFVNIAPAPTCPQPTGLTNLGATNTDIDLAWTPGGSETSWQIQYGPQGFALGTGDSVVTTTNPFDLTGLTTNSFYQVYVMAVCSSTDSSFYTGPISFNTYNQGIYMDWSTDCPAAGFINIASTGTDLGLTDDSEAGLTLPFPILYQGGIVNNCTIGNNGGMALGTTSAQIGYGGNMTTQPGSFIFPWGDDLDDETGNVYYQTNGTAPNRTFIVQWDNICNFSGSVGAPAVTFEVQFDEATGKIWFVYDDVIFGGSNASDDYAANADIGVSGPNQDLNVSNDNSSYLQSNSCVEFYYTDCPQPKNFVTTLLTPEEIDFSWSAGLSNETTWIIEYGPAGFTPGTGIIYTETNNPSTISGLTQLTDYTIYIYANCANGDTSLSLIHNFTTLPYCSNPSTLAGTSDVDSLEVTWNWVSSDPGTYDATSFNIQYGMNGMTSTEVMANGINFADTVVDASLLAGGVYQVYVQAVCANTNDSSAWVGPITVVMPLSNDTVCGAENLALATTYTFNNVGATVSLNESNVAPPATGAQTTTGWANSTLNGTTWFKFVAPPSGSVRINNTAINYDGQIAVYDVADCGDFNSNFLLLAANDDAIGGTSSAPNFTVCGLTPGHTYYMMNDPFTGTFGNYSISITEIVLQAGAADPLTKICTGDVIDLFTTINGNDTGGMWSAPVAAANASITGSSFNSSGLGYQVFNFQYRMTDGCAYDSIVSQIQIYGLSNAGTDGTVTVCKNQPLELLSGLSGNVDVDGTWYDPANNPIAGSTIHASQFPGSFNYDYITGNGVCPDDSSNVVVVVLSTCDFLSIQEEVFAGVQLYPNPTTGIIKIDADKAFKIDVTDANGRVVKAEFNSTIGTTTIDLSKAQVGVYFVTLKNTESSKVFRVVVQ